MHNSHEIQIDQLRISYVITSSLNVCKESIVNKFSRMISFSLSSLSQSMKQCEMRSSCQDPTKVERYNSARKTLESG